VGGWIVASTEPSATRERTRWLTGPNRVGALLTLMPLPSASHAAGTNAASQSSSPRSCTNIVRV